jgi:hypothetical protein
MVWEVGEAVYAVIPTPVRREAMRSAMAWRDYEKAMNEWRQLPRKKRRSVAMPSPPEGA